MDDTTRLRRLTTSELTAAEIASIRRLLRDAFGDDEDYGEHDWANATGGTHFVLDLALDGEIVAHASVVERELQAGGVPVRTGYVEAVATRPDRQGRGLGSRVMVDVGDHVRASFELGALSTGRPAFYERLGWRRWLGPLAVRAPDGERPTPEDEGGVFVLPTPTSPPLDRNARLVCDWRLGDVW